MTKLADELEALNGDDERFKAVCSLNQSAIITALRDVDRLREACEIALGHMTGGLDGNWADRDPVEVIRAALEPHQ